MNKQPDIIQPEHYQDNDEDGRVVEAADLGALVQLNSSEINQQIITARAYPRSITTFRKQMRELVTLDGDVAQSCLYALKRGGKVIEGPSARFAEVAAQMWGNCRAGARVIDIGDQFITAQGAFYDLEKNMAVSYEVLRRITDKEGNRFGDDMIGVTGNAACSIAIRNAMLKGVPKAFWNDAYQEARSVAFGKGETLANKRATAIKAFQAYGIDPPQIYQFLGIGGHADMTIDHLVLLGGIHTAIKEGDTTPEEAFAVDPGAQKAGTVTPPRPAKSEFERKATKSEKQAETSTGAKPEPEPVVQAEPETQSDVVEETGADPAANAFEDWYTEQKEYLATLAKVRDVAELRQAVTAQIDHDASKMKEFGALCDKRTRDILDATKKPGKK